MSADQWTHRVGSKDPFIEPPVSEDDYQAWQLNKQGYASSLILVPSPDSRTPQHREPYMQAVTIQVDLTTSQLCMLCSSTGNIIFITGTKLEELADLIDAKRVRSIHVYDKATHGDIDLSGAVVTDIRVELAHDIKQV